MTPPSAGNGAAAGDGGASDAGPKKSKLAPAPTDGLSLAERMERRKASDAKLAAQLAADENKRLLDYDKTKVAHDDDDLNMLGLAIGFGFSAYFTAKQALETLALAAATIEDLDAIDVSQGWP